MEHAQSLEELVIISFEGEGEGYAPDCSILTYLTSLGKKKNPLSNAGVSSLKLE